MAVTGTVGRPDDPEPALGSELLLLGRPTLSC